MSGELASELARITVGVNQWESRKRAARAQASDPDDEWVCPVCRGTRSVQPDRYSPPEECPRCVDPDKDESPPMKCLTCGSSNGVTTTNEADETWWTCFGCGDEWPDESDEQ